jgi:hypothetical protein
MAQPKYPKTRLKFAQFIAIFSILTACASAPPAPIQLLDESTGVTTSRARTPLTMVRDTPMYGAHSRSFVQVGTIEVNHSGSIQYYLWLGTWNTDHVASTAEHRDGFDSIILFVDGEPLLLDAVGWTPAAIGVSAPVYTRPFSRSVDAYYRVNTNQLGLIANSNDLRLLTSSSTPREFELWDTQTKAKDDLSEFLRAAAFQ